MIIENTSTRDEILTLVSSMTPYDELEKEHLDFVKEWLISDSEIFRLIKPDYPKIHLVSYCVVFNPSTNEVLLVDHNQAQLWLPPGGHVELDEHPKEAAKRETLEELGIEARFLFDCPQFITVTDTVGHVSHTDVSLWYVLQANKDDFFTFDAHEFSQVQWFLPEEVPYERSDLHLKRFLDKFLNKMTPAIYS